MDSPRPRQYRTIEVRTRDVNVLLGYVDHRRLEKMAEDTTDDLLALIEQELRLRSIGQKRPVDDLIARAAEARKLSQSVERTVLEMVNQLSKAESVDPRDG